MTQPALGHGARSARADTIRQAGATRPCTRAASPCGPPPAIARARADGRTSTKGGARDSPKGDTSADDYMDPQAVAHMMRPIWRNPCNAPPTCNARPPT